MIKKNDGNVPMLRAAYNHVRKGACMQKTGHRVARTATPGLLALAPVAACMVLLGAVTLWAQLQAPPAPWRGAGPTPCVGSDGGIYKCPPAAQTIAVRAGHLFDSKNGTMLTKQVVVLQGDKIIDVGPEAQVKIPGGGAGDRLEPGHGLARID